MMYDSRERDGGPRPEWHYYGDRVRSLFIFAAVLIIGAAAAGATLPFSTTGAGIAMLVLAIAAGVTNPRQRWSNWANEIIAALGAFLFSVNALERLRASATALEPTFAFTAALAVVFLFALYFATKTVRGMLLRS